MKRTVLSLTSLVSIALLAAGCTPFQGTDTAERSANQSATDLAWEPCLENDAELESQLNALGRTSGDILCTFLPVPIDWDDPQGSAVVELSVIRIAASTNESQGALFVNPGGPGESGVDLAIDLALSADFAPIGAAYDLVSFDPRGTGMSEPLECATVADCTDVPLAEHAGTVSVATDMDWLRAQLGYESLNYLGWSYGSTLGATYAHLFPEQTRRMVLDGASDSEWATTEGYQAQSEAFQTALESLLEQCPASASCPFAEGREDEYLDGLDSAPLITSDGSEVTGEVALEYLTESLYGTGADRESAFETLSAAAGGDQEAIDQVGAEAGVSHLSAAGIVIACLSDPTASGECADLSNAGSDYVESFRTTAFDRILVIGITADPATPYQGTRRLAQDLGGSRLLTVEGTGHGASFGGRSSCADAWTTKFLVEGQLPPPGTICEEDLL